VNPGSVTRPVALRTALIWRDEVMSDIVAETPQKITIGHKGKPTFVVPDVGLPPGFAIVSPGNRGYVLTLSEGMRGTISIDGKEHEVADFVKHGEGAGAPGGFCATPIGGRDWGVVDLDGSGDYKLYFQFVPVDAPLHNNADLFTTLTLAAAAAMLFIVGLVAAGLVIVALTAGTMEEALPRLGMLMFGAVAMAFLMTHPGSHARIILLRCAMFIGGTLGLIGIAWVQMQLDWSLLEWVTRGALLIPAGVIVFGMCWSLAMSDPEQQASTGFSIVLHGALLIGTIIIYDPADDPNVWPGPRDLTGKYLTERLVEIKQPEAPQLPTLGKVEKQDAAPKSENKEKLKTATKNDEGASGGKGDVERARNKDAKDDEKPDPPKIAFFEDKNKKILDNIIDKSVNVGAFAGIKGDVTKKGGLGFGGGTGTGVGDEQGGTGTTRGSKGKGTGGGGNVEGDFVTNKGKVDMGKERPGGNCVGANCKGAGPKEVQVNVGEMTGDPGGYTEDEINRVVKRSAGMFRACYQKELNRSPGIGGKVVVKFKIGADGAVITASPTGGTSMNNEAVKDCVARNVNRLKFPPKGAVANVTYPFLFSPGG
jgi:hypothetical protein